jgi:hypothetical protein
MGVSSIFAVGMQICGVQLEFDLPSLFLYSILVSRLTEPEPFLNNHTSIDHSISYRFPLYLLLLSPRHELPTNC